MEKSHCPQNLHFDGHRLFMIAEKTIEGSIELYLLLRYRLGRAFALPHRQESLRSVTTEKCLYAT